VLIVFPPEDAGAVKVTDTTPELPPEAVPIVGAPGTVVAVTAEEAEEVLAPVEFCAVTE
jgi:hypothetical protein